MITQRDIHEVNIVEDHFDIVKAFARSVEIGGRSSVYSDKAERKRLLVENQLTGQCGEYSGCVTLYDFNKYIEKQEQEVERGQGDYGTDIVGSRIPIDIKTSNVKVGPDDWGRVFYARHLLVSNTEYNPNSIYVGAVMLQAPKHSDNTATVYVMGWTWGRNIPYQQWRERPTEDYPNGREREGFRIKYSALKPLRRMDWGSLLEEQAVMAV